MSLETKKIPSRIDDPVQILFWEWDEMLVFVFVFGAGIVLNWTFTGLLAATAVTRQFKRSKGNSLRGRLNHISFWYGIADLNKLFRKGGKRTYFR